jgi:hypothetical protein
MFSMGKVEKKLSVDGTIDLSKSDFTNGIGNYTL